MPYRVSSRSGATAVTDAHALFTLWNPHTTQRITATEAQICATVAPGAGAGLELVRTTTIGTPTATITPTIDNDLDKTLAPPSGCTMGTGPFSVQPTLASGTGRALLSWIYAAVAASGLIIPFPDPIVIPPGTGLAWINASGIIFPISEVGWAWREY